MGYNDAGQSGYGQSDYGVNPFAAGASQIGGDLTLTLRTMRDSLSNSLQTLNLTMAGIHNQLRNMSSSMPNLGQMPTAYGSNTIPSAPQSAFLGSMSYAMANNISSASIPQMFFGHKPFNVGGNEWALERSRELHNRGQQMVVGGGINAASQVGQMLAVDKIVSMFTKLNSFGKFAASIPAYYAVSKVVDPFVSTMTEAASDYNHDIATMQRMSPNFGGTHWNIRNAGEAAKGIRAAYGSELTSRTHTSTDLGPDGYRQLMAQGMESNLFKGSSPAQLVKQMEGAAGVVKFLTGILGSKDISETIAAVKVMKDQGINLLQKPEFAKMLGHTASAYGATMGLSPADMISQASMHSSQFSNRDMAGFMGMQPAMQTMALVSEMEKRRFLSPAQLAAGGGAQNIVNQSMGFTAMMAGHSAIGKVMLGAGMTGNNGYSKTLMQQNLKGGYMGAVNNLVGNIGGNIPAYAAFMTSIDDNLASAAEQGNIDEQLGAMLKSAMSMQPGLVRDENTAVLFLQSMAEQNGTPVTMAAAKVIAAKIFRPKLMKALANKANTELSKGYAQYNMMQTGSFRNMQKIGEHAVNTWDSAWHGVGDVGVRAAQYVNDLLGKSDADNMFTLDAPDGIIGKGSVEAARRMDKLSRKFNPISKQTSMSFEEYQKNARIGEAGLGTGNLVSLGGPLGAVAAMGYNWLQKNPMAEAEITAGRARSNAAYYKGAAGQSKISSAEARYNLSQMGIDTSGMGSYGFFSNDAEDSPAKEMMNNNANNATADKWSRYITNSREYNMLTEEEARGIGDSAITRGASKNAILDYYKNPVSQTESFRALGARNNWTAEQTAFAIANKIGTGEASNYTKSHGASKDEFQSTYENTGVLAKSKGRQGNALSMYAQSDLQESTKSDLIAAFDRLGLPKDQLISIIQEGDTASIESFIAAMGKISEGDELGAGADIAHINNPILKELASSYAEVGDATTDEYGLAVEGEHIGKNKFIRAIGSKGTFGYNGPNGNMGIMQRMGGAFGKLSKSLLNDNILANLRDINGFDISSDELNKAIDSNSLGDLVNGKSGNAEGENLKRTLERIKGMTPEQKAKYIQEGHLNPTGEKLTISQMESKIFGDQLAITSKPALLNSEQGEKSVIDKTVVFANGVHAIRTIAYTDPEAKKADEARTPAKVDFFGKKWELHVQGNKMD